MSYENKILQMKKMIKKSSSKEEEKKTPFAKPSDPAYTKDWEMAGLKRIENQFGMVFLLETHYPLETKHGDFLLGDLYNAFRLWSMPDNSHPIELTKDDQLIFYDTETTGLRGVGTQIFLNGILEVSQAGFILKQYVLAEPSHETAFLYESKLWEPNKTLVTYNGKSFDWPQLQTRFTLHKKDLPNLPEQRHIDLLHGSKRIWKNDLSRMKLTQIEEEKLGFKRVGDIPGYLAPIIYLDAIKSGNPDVLLKVLDHNKYDLLSLVTLYIHATNLLCESEEDESSTTITNIGKWYGDLSDYEKGSRVLEKVTNQFNSNEAGYAHYHLAFQRKKQHLYEEAYQSFMNAVPFLKESEQLIAYIELAKIDEHRRKDYQSALFYTYKAERTLNNMQSLDRDKKLKKFNEISHRQLRLKKKQSLHGK
ncbi:ribonuclease H-like domain-containing protein [Rummeliibacillus stabekisii]|uniref:Exonuclease n=1 Tax=Rummeliibacillus stabekisii TaxID=241244 RepID=A0A143HDW6_9BACL|nr:ribonuclease H-like domain-containing protein [Rummeliibacillus stabekisii]AMW99451.1 exonuclease [Rummeliibacillus stabekisii]